MADAIPFRRPDTARLEPFGDFDVSGIMRPPPAREWMVDAAILRRTVCLVTGAPDLGKSRLLQHLASAAALGRPWLGRHVMPARSFAMFCQDDQEELERRQADINAHFDVMPPDYEGRFTWNSRVGKSTRLIEFERYTDKPIFTDLWRQMWQFVADMEIELVILDPASSIFGGNINYANHVELFLQECHRQVIRINGALVIAIHPNKLERNGIGGSIQWEGAVRSVLSLRRPKDYDEETDTPSDARELWVLKGNYLPKRSRDRLHWQDGVFVPDDVAAPTVPVTDIDKMELDYRLLAGLRRALSNGAKVPADVAAPRSMPYLARMYAADLARVPFNTLYAAQDRLLQRGQIVRVRVGSRCLIRPVDVAPYDGESEWPS